MHQADGLLGDIELIIHEWRRRRHQQQRSPFRSRHFDLPPSLHLAVVFVLFCFYCLMAGIRNMFAVQMCICLSVLRRRLLRRRRRRRRD